MNERDNSSSLRSPGLLAKKPIIGFLMFFISLIIFAALAYNLANNGPLIKWDLSVNEYFHNFALNSSTLMTQIMVAGYYIGLEGIIIAEVLLGGYFFFKKSWREFAMSGVVFIGGGLLFKILSQIFMRPRPFTLFDKLIWAGSPNIPGFPSGHALNIILVCGILIYLFFPKIKSPGRKFIMILVSLLVILYISLSRLYVGDHYLTDIIAGYAIGIAWFGLACTSIELLFKKYKKV